MPHAPNLGMWMCVHACVCVRRRPSPLRLCVCPYRWWCLCLRNVSVYMSLSLTWQFLCLIFDVSSKQIYIRSHAPALLHVFSCLLIYTHSHTHKHTHTHTHTHSEDKKMELPGQHWSGKNSRTWARYSICNTNSLESWLLRILTRQKVGWHDNAWLAYFPRGFSDFYSWWQVRSIFDAHGLGWVGARVYKYFNVMYVCICKYLYLYVCVCIYIYTCICNTCESMYIVI